jgi:hypothetical protein
MRRRARPIAVLALLLVLASACSSNEDPKRGVGIKSVDTNIGLGVEVTDTAPANTVVRPPKQRRAPEITLPTIPPLPDFNIPKPVTGPCPPAGPFDFPAKEASVELRGRPRPGNYQWKLDGKVSDANGVQKVDTFETRTISNVRDDPTVPESFFFDVTQRYIIDERQGNGTIVTTYKVVPRSPAQTNQTNADTGKGLFIDKVVFNTTDEEGKPVHRTFDPLPDVSLMAFPVRDGTAIDSSGSDPSNGTQLQIHGKVDGHRQVDACGDRVDSWYVDGEQTYLFPDPETRQVETLQSNYDYGVATQYGGEIVVEHVEAPADSPVITIESRVGAVPKD